MQGNILGKGNPFARHSAALRHAFYEAVTPDDLRAIACRLVAAAKDGDWVAAQLLLRWLLGRPPEATDPWRVMARAAAEAALELARREERGEPADVEEVLGRREPPLTLR